MIPKFIANPSNTPEDADIYLRADFVELQCVIDPDKQMTRDQILEFYRKEKDLNVTIAEENIDAEIGSLPQIDRWTQTAEDWYELLEYRQLALDELYPFVLSEDKHTLTLKSEITQAHKVYLFLLLCSCCRNLDKTTQSLVTSCFEFLSKAALQNYLPSVAEVRLFGVNHLDQDGPYNTHFVLDKIDLLAEHLGDRVVLDDEGKKEYQGKGGDNGLDLVAWIRFEDNQGGMLCVFAQCACTTKWNEKQNSSHRNRWNRFIGFTASPINFVFIPFFFRNTYGKWSAKTRIEDSVLVDRLRVMKLLKNYSEQIENFPEQLIDDLLSAKT